MTALYFQGIRQFSPAAFCHSPNSVQIHNGATLNTRGSSFSLGFVDRLLHKRAMAFLDSSLDYVLTISRHPETMHVVDLSK
ncbi:hypothetical protein ACYPKM_01095 [Pseudomonas aeruginosa]